MDLKIIETGSGGDLVFEDGDISLTSEVFNQPYLSHFGGNKEALTSDYTIGEERKDYWANTLILQDNERFDSEFEKMLNSTELSSSGRLKLEQAAKNDLIYLDGFSDKTSSVNITGSDKILLTETLTKGNNNSFTYIWGEAKDEII
jgi:hypothetical protein